MSKSNRAPRLQVTKVWSLLVAFAVTTHASADSPTPEQIEFFESSVRPILVEHCYECHSAEAEDLEASLLLDSKAGWTTGGDSGPAIVPGKPDDSLLVDAIRYQEDVISGMPPKSKLPQNKIKILEQWIAMGAPDPRTESSSLSPVESFDLKSRVAEHWSWQPIKSPEPPPSSNPQWSDSAIDMFVLSKLNQAGLKPALAADKQTWLRRVYLDLIGLPPGVEQIEAFLADESDDSYQRVVKELLNSKHYGEKWARHWMDLVRYCETYGHEFDYPIRAAHEYRDYLIRAFNADIPYDQFIREQIAGDIIPNPRRHPTEDFDESIIGTGFWYFHDATHAPTDPLGNEADIISNQLDVFSKSFLGLTVACARCHDHKFDAISTADYYALSAYIQSSCRQYAPLDPGRKIEKTNTKIESFRSQADTQLRTAASTEILDTERLKQLAATAKQQKLAVNVDRQNLGSELLQDFESQSMPDGWSTSGHAFEAVSKQILTADGGVLSPGTVSSRVLGRKQRGILRSPTFELTSKRIHLRMKATANVRVIVVLDNYQMAPFNALLFKGTFIQGKETETDGHWRWKTLGGDLRKYTGHKAYLEFIDEGDGYIEIDEIRLSDTDAPQETSDLLDLETIGERWIQEIESLRNGSVQPFAAWLIERGLVPVEQFSSDAGRLISEAKSLADKVPTPRYVLAMAEGTHENARVYVRGSHKSLGNEVPPRFLEALGGREAGRLELAGMIANEQNPLTARVIVNRLWHHLFGHGIVPSVDDFGPQGQPPSHPELLDHLASDLIQNDWSLKKTLGNIVLSQTYRQQSVPHPDLTPEQIAAADPTNQLLYKMPVRRLSSETIRDSILSVSGGLNTKQFGPSVPTHLTSFMTGRGRPNKSGPLDGNGRRSVYLAVTRNFLNPLMLTFDMPSPFGPQGRRSRSNVPAQALALLNDPFVSEQAGRWADRILAMPDMNDRQRSALMMQEAHGVQPNSRQAEAMESFLAAQSEVYGTRDRRAWADSGAFAVQYESVLLRTMRSRPMRIADPSVPARSLLRRHRIGEHKQRKACRLHLAPIQIACVLFTVSVQTCFAKEASDQAIDLFEKRIRPVLVQECQRCHGEKKQQANLRLDSRDGWTMGGDTGPALVAGDAQSLLLKAIRYEDVELEMPPDGKLPDEVIADFELWVSLGALDPRVAAPQSASTEEVMPPTVEEGRSFWSFLPVIDPPVPAVQETAWPSTDIDRFVLAQLERGGLEHSPPADDATLLRRLYYDLIGLPPTPNQIQQFLADPSEQAYESLVSRLLESDQFGQRWGRHWLDVVRYAESSGGGRTLLFPEAWRYRDYVIDSFNSDLPFDQFVTQQIAGDLLAANDWQQRRRNLIATAFLLLGPTNYELQDKDVLEMDVIDEQLDTMGKALLGMTIGCARCHDHKFDPIPASDYYAMAGVLKSSLSLKHSNVSAWNKVKLPLSPDEAAKAKEITEKLEQAKAELKSARKNWSRAGGVPETKQGQKSIDAELIGADIVIDNDQAERIGSWNESTSVATFIGKHYLFSAGKTQSESRVVYRPKLSEPGHYELLVSYTASSNRTTRAPFHVHHAGGTKTARINQRKKPSLGGKFESLGVFEFDPQADPRIVVSCEDTDDGCVIADAVIFVASSKDPRQIADDARHRKELFKQVELLEKSVKELEKSLPKPTSAMAMADHESTGDIHLAIRGSTHQKGDLIPRGVLQVASWDAFPPIADGNSGRKQLAEWIVHPQNPLTARVIVNRVWYWLVGRGIVSSVDNFGAMGELPSDPKLLDHLASSFFQDGWSIKELIRRIVTSRTYQQSSASNELMASIDPENRFQWRMNRKRLRAEDIRDSLLSIAGQLDMRHGGSNIKPGTKSEYDYEFSSLRRSVYVPVFRNTLPEIFEVFDFADPNIQRGDRSSSTVSSQALLMMNHPFVINQAQQAATELVKLPDLADHQRVERAYLQVIGRPPGKVEMQIALDLISDTDNNGSEGDGSTGLAMLYQVLFQCIDFRYLN